MKFDIKDLKTWSNRHDVKVGDKGYFFHEIDILLGSESECLKPVKGVLSSLRNNYSKCFKIELGHDDDDVFEFFLPLNAVKEDKSKEKKYRPFKDLYEFYKFLSISPFTKKEFRNEFLLKFSFTYREKTVPQIASTVAITRIDVGLDNDPCSTYINGKDLKYWFDDFEFMNSKGEWVPFGVEAEND